MSVHIAQWFSESSRTGNLLLLNFISFLEQKQFRHYSDSFIGLMIMESGFYSGQKQKIFSYSQLSDYIWASYNLLSTGYRARFLVIKAIGA
jgi:hypothetical protein